MLELLQLLDAQLLVAQFGHRGAQLVQLGLGTANRRAKGGRQRGTDADLNGMRSGHWETSGRRRGG